MEGINKDGNRWKKKQQPEEGKRDMGRRKERENERMNDMRKEGEEKKKLYEAGKKWKKRKERK